MSKESLNTITVKSKIESVECFCLNDTIKVAKEMIKRKADMKRTYGTRELIFRKGKTNEAIASVMRNNRIIVSIKYFLNPSVS